MILNKEAFIKENGNELLKNAEILVTAGEYKVARKLLLQGIYSGAPPSEFLYLIAETYLKENNLEKAERVLRDSIAYLPTTKAYFSLVRVLLSQGLSDRAVQVLKRCLDLKGILSTEKVEIYKSLGNVYMDTDQLQNALEAYDKALELKEDMENHCNMGSCYLRLRDLEGAKSHFLSAARLNAKSGKPYFGLASCALGIGNRDSALTFLVKSLERDIHSPAAIFYLVKCAYDVKKYDSAEKILRQYLDVSPVNSSLLYSLAGLQYHLGKKNECLSTIEQLLKMNANHEGAKKLKELI